MLIYYIITLLGAILMLYTQQRYERLLDEETGLYTIKKRYVKKYIIPFIPMFLLSALRYGIGTDYFHTYYPTFNRIYNGGDIDYASEIGFYYINKMVALFSDDVTWVLAILAFITFVFMGTAIVQQSENPAFSMALIFGTGLFSYSINGVRQCLVIAIWFYAMRFIKQKKLIAFLISIAFSMLFHFSGILLIPMYFVYQKKMRPPITIGIIAGVIILSVTLRRVILFVAQFTRYLDKFTGSILLEGNFAYSEFFVSLLIVVYLLFLYKFLHKSWKYNFLLISMTIAVAGIYLTKDIYIVARLTVFFKFIPVLYLPTTLKAFKGNGNKFIVSVVLILAYFAYIGFMMGYLNNGESVPYQSIFDRW